MNELNYKPNSYKAKEEAKVEENNLSERKKAVTKVVKGQVKTKKNEFRKFADIFAPGDVSNVKSYILMEVVVPGIKKAISDIVTNGIDMLLYGETGRNKKNYNAGNISYRSYYDRRDDDRRYSSQRTLTGYSYNDIIIETRGEAEDVLARMDELIDQYGLVSVADLYDLVGITGNYTDNKYGWTNIRSAEVVRVRDGYVLKLPKALPLN